MMQQTSKYKTALRWLSILPVAFTAFVLSDWAVRFLFWFMRLPIIAFERITGVRSGHIGKLMDSITNYLIGLDSISTITIIATSLVTGYTAVYILAVIAPANNKKTATALMAVYLVILALGLIAFIINGTITGENILYLIFLSIGILSAWHSAKNETEQRSMRYEKFVSNNIFTILISTSLFTVFMMAFIKGL
ncbi:MAG: hypothetical protein WA240_09575 [Nitrospirota bacterium]